MTGYAAGAGERPAAARASGRADAQAYLADPSILPTSRLATFRAVPLQRLLLRRVLHRLPRLATVAARCPLPSLRSAGVDAAYWSGARAAMDRTTWSGLIGGTTILMYHAFAQPGEARSRYVLTPRQLRRQLRLLRLLRRQVISLHDYVARRERGLPPPARATILTIDDGYADTFEVAAPVLEGAGVPATLFVVSGRVGEPARWSDQSGLAERPMATWSQLVDAPAHGIDIGGHGRTHAAMAALDREAAAAEARGCLEDLEAGLGRPVPTFAFPFGDETPAIREVVRAEGFRAACTSHGGVNSIAEPLHSLRRVEVRGDDPLWRFVPAVLLGSAGPRRR